ncbi:MAG: DUF4922 domain-containing protein [Bacteroidales bacterium]
MGKVSSEQVLALIDSQLAVWDTAKGNYDALSTVKVKELKIGKSTVKVQFNPARITSSAAKVDPKTIKERKCFLCDANRPDVQEGIAWGDDYTILVNPFPIFPKHLTIPANKHIDQLIEGRIGDMMLIAKDLDKFTLFYNGPKCGASAPDHMHFQAGNKGFMTVADDLKNGKLKAYKSVGGATLYKVEDLSHPLIIIKSSTVEDAETLFSELYAKLYTPEGEKEPMLNLLCWYADGGEWNIVVFPRMKHRPSCYDAEGDAKILISPASVDMGGVFIIPLEEDFVKISADNVKTIFDEVCMSDAEADEILKSL